MHKKLTITIDEDVYNALHRTIQTGKISQFIEELVKPHVINQGLESAYAEMAQDKDREQEALEWAEEALQDFLDEKR